MQSLVKRFGAVRLLSGGLDSVTNMLDASVSRVRLSALEDEDLQKFPGSPHRVRAGMGEMNIRR